MIKPFRWVKWLIKSIFGVKEMITLPTGLNEFMKGQNLDGLKPFALLYRNKWDSVNNKYALDTTPIDISALIAKPNTLSMTLDVNEVAQYNANNVTLTLSDTKNYFVEGTPNSYFPEGYQIYGSRIVLYYGTDGVNRTPLFTGVIKDLPTHKPENYQVDVKLVSPLEMLKDIEAKDFSDKVTGETLTYKGTDTSGHRIYWTTGLGVGGFDAVYANSTKLFEGIDYETDQLNAYGIPAIVTIINNSYNQATITADYYTWKTGLTVEQIVAGLVGLAGYDSGTEDIRTVAWTTSVRTQEVPTLSFSVGYKYQNSNLINVSNTYFSGTNMPSYTKAFRYSKFPSNFSMYLSLANTYHQQGYYGFGYIQNGNLLNGFLIRKTNVSAGGVEGYVSVYKVTNGAHVLVSNVNYYQHFLTIIKNGSSISFKTDLGIYTDTVHYTFSQDVDEILHNDSQYTWNSSYKITVESVTDTDDNSTITNEGAVFSPLGNGSYTTWYSINGNIVGNPSVRYLTYRTSDDGVNWTAWDNNTPAVDFGSSLGLNSSYLQFKIRFNTASGAGVNGIYTELLTSTLTLRLVNLSGLTVLEALQDFALISGYEFGVDRQGVFFFKPRVASTTPTYVLGHNEIVKVDTVKKNLSDFFTKLTLTFAQVPLEFYANTGERPTLVDKYGIINKEIDKPDIVNYDNPELAQAIGPQLLEVYSSLPNIIQVTGKLNLALELGDIVSLRRNMNLITPEYFSDYSKYTDLNTYYRACKITAMNYNFSKRQITYTLRDVSNKNTEPQYEFNEYIYDLAVQYGVKE